MIITDSMFCLSLQMIKFMVLVPIYGVFCGLGHNENVKYPQIIRELCVKNIKEFYNGLCFALSVDSNQNLYGWGFNDCGQLGRTINSMNNKPAKIEKFNNIKIKQICCGSAHTLMLTSDGIVYGFGSNYFGQIGCGKELGENISVITQLKTLKNIEAIYCSFCQSFALTENGMVYNWGRNLRHESQECEPKLRVFEPQLIENLSKIASICQSDNYTYFLTKNKAIYFCERYQNKQCYQPLRQFSNNILFQSLYSINTYQSIKSIGCALTAECVYYLDNNTIEKTEYKTLEDFYSNECHLTFKTLLFGNNYIRN